MGDIGWGGGNIGNQSHIFTRGETWDEIVKLKDKPDLLPPEPRAIMITGGREVEVAEDHATVGWYIETTENVQQG
jgi:hypothetical protein